ncbi:hypothetical protein L1887_26928 [Cichorium endivia]|nr:hypothetical protein L1887_26928 [Cichorium endivia]
MVGPTSPPPPPPRQGPTSSKLQLILYFLSLKSSKKPSQRSIKAICVCVPYRNNTEKCREREREIERETKRGNLSTFFMGFLRRFAL